MMSLELPKIKRTKGQNSYYGKESNLQRMDKELLKPQKSDPGIGFGIIAQSNIPGKSLNHINAFL